MISILNSIFIISLFSHPTMSPIQEKNTNDASLITCEKNVKYFAYGSNMSAKKMNERKAKFFQREHAILKNYKLEFNKISSRDSKEGYANIVPADNETVEGVLYEISNGGLRQLDKFEGVPFHYKRIKIKVRLDNGKKVEAFVYIAQSDEVKKGLLPTKEYLEQLLSAKDILSNSYYTKLALQKTLDQKLKNDRQIKPKN